MSKRLIVIAALTCIVTALAAQSPPPPPSPIKAAQEKQNERGIENRESKTASNCAQPPIAAIGPMASEPAKSHAQNQGEPNRNISSWNWGRIGAGLLVLFNGLLVGVGYLQWRSTRKQAGYMREGLKLTEQAANAATAAVAHAKNATAMTERAVVLIEKVEATMTSPASGLDVASVVIFTLKNFGGIIADSVELTGALTGIGNLPIDKLPPTTIAPQGNNSWITPSISHFVLPDLIQKINQGTGRIEYKIDVAYSDAFGAYKYHCEGRYEPSVKRFLITSSTSG